jgi:hypothetical protein
MSEFEFIGIYDSEEKADAACLDETYVMVPEELNYTYSKERTISTTARYPRLEEKEKKNDK